MKKLVAIALSLIMVIAVFPISGITFSVSADEVDNPNIQSGITDDCTWTLDDTTLTISGQGEMDNYNEDNPTPWGKEIAEVIIEDGVTNVGTYAFEECLNLETVTIPSSVSLISEYAFYGCKKLGSVTVPNGVKSIGDSAFERCSKLASITLPDSIRNIGSDAFYHTAYYNTKGNWGNNVLYINNHLIQSNGNNPSEYSVKDCAVSIADMAFAYNSKLTNITLPESIKSIGNSAFSFCTNLQKINIPDSVESIGDCAFNNCHILDIIVIPSGVTDIGSEAFYNTLYYNNQSNWEDGVLYIGNHLIYAEETETSDECTIKDGTLTVASMAFEARSNLKSISIPQSVTNIQDNTFRHCGELLSITVDEENTAYHSNNNCLIETETKTLIRGCENSVIPNDGSVEIIGNYAFENCQNLKTITLPDCLTTIGNNAFYYCSSLESITIPNTVTDIGKSAFFHCTKFESITIPNSVTFINNELFAYCENLKTVIIPDSITRICNSAFKYCESIENITLPDSITRLGKQAFYYCSHLKTLQIPNSVTSIGDSAFEYCGLLKGVILPNSVTQIGIYAFNYCSSLERITIPSGVKTVAEGTFAYCSNLKTAILSEGVTSIEYSAFTWCRNLESIVIPDSISSIGTRAFYYCNDELIILGNKDSYAEKFANENNIKFSEFNGTTGDCKWVVDKETLTISGAGATESLSFLSGITKNIVMEKGVTKIGSNAFEDFNNVTEIVLPDSVTEICDGAFLNCASLKSLTIPNSVTTVGYGALSGCASLESIVLPSGINTISEEIFNGCTSLKSITIPHSVTKIESNAFYGCKNLESITVPSSVTSIGYSVFENCSDTFTIYGSHGTTAEKYANDNGIKFVATDKCDHSGETYISGAIDSTCTTAGYSGDVMCKDCDEIITKGTTVNAKGHNTAVIGKKPATCKNTGYTGDTKCTVCGTVTYKGKTIPKIAHKTATKVTRATLNSNGKVLTTCTVCKQVTKTVTINKIATVKLSTANYTYNGKVKTPTVSVKDYKGKVLKNGADYTVSYAKGRKYVGKYAVKVTFKGNYSGSKTVYFNINPKGTSLKSVAGGKKQVTVKWNKQGTQTSGYQIQYSTSKSFKGAKTVTVSSNKTTSKTIKNLKSKKTYYLRVRTYKTVSGSKYYSAWSSAKHKKTK